MTIDVDWAGTDANPYRIFVPKADMTLVQSTPIEVREFDVAQLHLDLRTLAASESGIPYPRTHVHVTQFLLSGATYARIIAILAPYTVEFEDGQYVVQAIGANHNLADRKVPNQVSLATNNSAGLIQSVELQFASYDGGVHADPNNLTGMAQSGTTYPVGTARRPVDNFSDAAAIASAVGLRKLFIRGMGLTLAAVDVSGLEVVGEEEAATSLSVLASATVVGTKFEDMAIDGTFDGVVTFINCKLGDVSMVEGEMDGCGIGGTITLDSGGTVLKMLECYDSIQGVGTPTIDFGGVGIGLIMRRYQGGLVFQNKSGGDEASIDLMPGRMTLDATITGGDFIVKGIGTVTDNSGGTATVNTDNLLNADANATGLLTSPVAGYGAGSTGDALERARDEATLARKVYGNRQEMDFAAQQLVTYDDNDAVLRRQKMETDDGSPVIPFPGTATKRGKPT